MNTPEPNNTTNTEEETLKAIKGGKYRDCYLIYNRKSTDEPDNQKNSLKYQKSENARFAYREGLKVAQVTLPGFCLDGMVSEKHSGFKEDSELTFGRDGTIQYRVDRPKFYQLVQFLNRGCFKGVISLCWDRASRNKGDNTIIDKLIKQGVDVRFALASYDKTSAGALHMDIDGMFAEHNSRVTSEKVRLNIRKQKDLGFVVSKAPVGYLNPGKMEHKPADPERAPIIVKICELYATGQWSMSALARWATDQGFTMPPARRKRTREERMAEEEDDLEVVPEPICRPPKVNNIQRILTNRFYLGEIMDNDGNWVKSNSHEALVSRELFDKVQAVLNKKYVSVCYTKSLEYPMRGIIRCEGCSRLYTPYTKKGILYFGCHCSKDCPNPKKSINITWLSDQIGERIRKLSFTDAETAEINMRADTDISLLEKQRESQSGITERKKKKLKEDLAYLLDNKLTLLKTGVYTAEALVEEEERLNRQLKEMEDQETVSGAELREKVADLLKLSELLKRLYLYYENANPYEKEKIIKILFSELTLSENNLIYKVKEGLNVFVNRFLTFCAQDVWLSEVKQNDSRSAIVEVEALMRHPP